MNEEEIEIHKRISQINKEYLVVLNEQKEALFALLENVVKYSQKKEDCELGELIRGGLIMFKLNFDQKIEHVFSRLKEISVKLKEGNENGK